MKNCLLTCSICLLLSSCGSIWIAPPYTDSEKIVALKPTMDIAAVNEKLGIPPFDIYHLQGDGNAVLVYNYRLKNRRFLYGNENKRHDETSQTAGKLWYSDESYLVYVLFEEGKMKSLITDAGRDNSEGLLITNNTIQLLTKDELELYELAKMRYLLNNELPDETVIPFFEKMKKGKKKKNK